MKIWFISLKIDKLTMTGLQQIVKNRTAANGLKQDCSKWSKTWLQQMVQNRTAANGLKQDCSNISKKRLQQIDQDRNTASPDFSDKKTCFLKKILFENGCYLNLIQVLLIVKESFHNFVYENWIRNAYAKSTIRISDERTGKKHYTTCHLYFFIAWVIITVMQVIDIHALDIYFDNYSVVLMPKVYYIVPQKLIYLDPDIFHFHIQCQPSWILQAYLW